MAQRNDIVVMRACLRLRVEQMTSADKQLARWLLSLNAGDMNEDEVESLTSLTEKYTYDKRKTSKGRG